MVAQRPVSRRLKIRYRSVFRSRSRVGRLWFRSPPLSLRRIYSIPTLAAAQIPGQMEFSAGTGGRLHSTIVKGRELQTQGQAQGGTTRCSGQDREAFEQLEAGCASDDDSNRGSL